MATVDDIARIIEQERGLVFERFDEEAAFAIGSAIRVRAASEALAIVVEIRLWDRPLFYCALPGTTADNVEWVRRKANVVRRFHKSTYRMVLERPGSDRVFPPGLAADPADYVLAGGGFPIHVKGVGAVGSITVSGLPERQDHEVVVAALCDWLDLARESFALGSE